MASLRDIRARITGVEKMQKIVSAMKMVATAKLARAQLAIQQARPYAEKLRAVLASTSGGVSADEHPLLNPRDPVHKLDLVLLTSDRGLCGAYNSNVTRHALAYAGKIAPRYARDESIIVNLSGRGDKDIATVAALEGIRI